MSKPEEIQFWAEITRVSDEDRTVEGYAFVNEIVEEGGVRLKRSAMEAATPGYMEYGAVREMHQPIAAGTATSVEWTDKGALIRAKIVDAQAWEKVKEGVYKGFSVGVRPIIKRGRDVESAQWMETSLVDRPADPGAKFLLKRVEYDSGEAEPDEGDVKENPTLDVDSIVERVTAALEQKIAEVLQRCDTLAEKVDRLEACEPLPDATVTRRAMENQSARPAVRFPAALERTLLGDQKSRDKDEVIAEIERSAAGKTDAERHRLAAQAVVAQLGGGE